MTTAKTPKYPSDFQLPEPPKSQDEKMTASQHLSLTGGAHYLALHLGSPDTTIVGSDLYITRVPTGELSDMSGVPYPDLMVAFNVDPAAYLARNGYVISEQGKPPDFVLEVASRSTGRRDTTTSGSSTLTWASRNTGASTRRAGTTALAWPETGWWTVNTCPSRLTNCPTAAYRGTAPS